MKKIRIALTRTLHEIVRARSLAGLAVFIVLLGWGSFFVGSLTIGSRLNTAVDLALAASALFTAVLGILLAVEHIGAASAPSSWPLLASGLSRAELLIGRWAAVMMATTAAAAAPPLIMRLIAYLLGLNINTATATGREDALAMAAAVSDLTAATLLLPLEGLLIASIAGALALAFPRAVAVSLSAGIWAAGHLHPDPLTFVILFPGKTGVLLQAVGRLLPELELYNARVTGDDPALLAAAILQALLFTAGASGAGLLVYRRRDL